MIKPNRALAKHFLSWGGFHKLEPVEKTGMDIKETVWHEQPQMRMRAALQRCSRVSGFPNPAIISKRTARGNDGKVSNSSPSSASMHSPGSSSPTTLDIPISHESTSNPTQSRSLPTESPQPPSESPPEPTQPSPKPTPPEITIPPPGQLTPEQPKKASQRQMSKVKEPMVDKQGAARKAQKPVKEPEEKGQMPLVPDKSPEEPLQPRSSIVAKLWKLLGR